MSAAEGPEQPSPAALGGGVQHAPQRPSARDATGTPDPVGPDQLDEASARAMGGPSGPPLDDPDAQRQRVAALGRILRRTAQRPVSVAEARDRLVADQIEPEAVAAAIADAAALRALDDRAFAEAWVHDRGQRRGWGAARLRTELRRRRVDDADIDAALAALDDRDDEGAAEALARDRMTKLPAGLEPEKAVRRLVGYLVRRGHPPGLSQRVAIRVTGLDTRWD